MNSAHKTRSDDKRDTVRNAVALMQHQTRAKAAGMGKAAEAVLGLIDAIKSHQAEDSKRKRFCEAQLGSNEDAKAKLQGELTRLKARQDFLGSEVGTLGTQVEDLKKEAQDFTDRLSKLEEVRSKEKESYDASSRDRALTIKVVKKAKAILEGFYNSKDATALAEVNASPKKAPDTWQLGSSRNGNLGSSVIAMLDTIVWDFQKEQSDAEKAEENAEAELEKVREDTKTLFDKKLEHVSKLLQEKARDAQELSQVKADVELKGTSLAATEDTLAKLGEDCTQLLAGFDKTLADRQKQIYQLKDVAEILGGATVGTRTGVRAGLLELQSLRP
ncbi:unnamed protein product [Effrenium voratum]|uniref:Uncharacterized protein n=1 Tax=Effrenium voratum TaxID=2562239 RepID=A0AA36MXR0_9DINO|nr:unnamed protein product [Effrenium voratum]CAJ1449791.1 unnamed protein product [Effrenium voratum]